MNRYIDIRYLRDCYSKGMNILQTINKKYGLGENDPFGIEISNDLQSGAYVSVLEEEYDFMDQYTEEQASIINRSFPNIKSILDAGCGELTVASVLFNKLGLDHHFCTDISWSRLNVGWEFFADYAKAPLPKNTTLFSADLQDLPLSNNSIDIVITGHSIEPNHGREKEIINELLRVSRYGLVLFESSYELANEEQKAHMDSHNYSRELPEHIRAAGGKIVEITPMKIYKKSINPTVVYVVKKNCRLPSVDEANMNLVDPISKMPLREVADGHFLHCSERGILYPILKSIPILRQSVQILASRY